MSATLLPSPCKRTTGRPSPPPRRPLYTLRKECDGRKTANNNHHSGFNPRTPYGVRRKPCLSGATGTRFQSTHSLRSATQDDAGFYAGHEVSIHALLAECDQPRRTLRRLNYGFNPRTPCGVRRVQVGGKGWREVFQSTHSLRSATDYGQTDGMLTIVSIHALLTECDRQQGRRRQGCHGFNPRTPYGVRRLKKWTWKNSRSFQSTHSLRSATAADLIHCYSTEQIILCANLPKKTVIARLHFLSIYLSIFYSQCITPIADLPGNSCELEVGAQAMFNSI